MIPNNKQIADWWRQWLFLLGVVLFACAMGIVLAHFSEELEGRSKLAQPERTPEAESTDSLDDAIPALPAILGERHDPANPPNSG